MPATTRFGLGDSIERSLGLAIFSSDRGIGR
jgi:hypothetical protein